MTDHNKIAVSFDETRAVRLRDGARLVAVPVKECWGTVTCHSCQAPSNGPVGLSGCSEFYARPHKHCHTGDRKDGKPIAWRPARE